MGIWDKYKEAQKSRRKIRQDRRVRDIQSLKRKGFKVECLSQSHYRIDGRLDIFPVHNQFRDLQTGKRGVFRDVLAFVLSYFGSLREDLDEK